VPLKGWGSALVKYRLPHLPYSPKSATGGRHSRNVSAKKGGRAATDDLCYAVCSGGAEHPRHLNVAPLQKWGAQDIRLTATRTHDAYGSSIRAQQASTLCSFFAEPSAVEAVPNKDLRELKN
jgi:hypothetical protein